MTPAETSEIPLCVDLDGSLLRTDVFLEALLRLLQRNPFFALRFLGWLVTGVAHAKQETARRIILDYSRLPVRSEVLKCIEEARLRGSPVYLATAADRRNAEAVLKRFPFFSGAIASDGVRNLKGEVKARALVESFGLKGFDYIGDSSSDLPVWRDARIAYIAGAGKKFENRVKKVNDHVVLLSSGPSLVGRLRATWRAFRPHQWVKNILVFIPMVCSHQLGSGVVLRQSLLAFLGFSLTASAGYLLNDLLDLEVDRASASKRTRPFAEGALSIPWGVLVMLLLLVGGLFIAATLGTSIFVVIAGYFLLSVSYSLKWKRLPVFDVVMLAVLYTCRIVAGHEATGIAYSDWLLAFSVFLFTSLAFLKRYAELVNAKGHHPGRDYGPDDLQQILSLGSASSYVAILVLALYIRGPEVTVLYGSPRALWGIVVLGLLWVNRIWVLAGRGMVDDDPIVFTLKDPASLAFGAAAALFGLIAIGR